MFILGLTGSIGMGKSTTAAMFCAAGIPVYDSDASVHALMSKGGAAIDAIAAIFPTCIVDGAVDRQALGGIVFGNDPALKQLEGILHPLVQEGQRQFVEDQSKFDHTLVVFDIPLLYETQANNRCDAVCVVTASEELQKQRVMTRPGMTDEKFKAILVKQTPDYIKRGLADHIITTDVDLETTQQQVIDLINKLKSQI